MSESVSLMINRAKNLIQVLSRYRVIILLLVTSSAVIAALLISSSYLDVTRNDELYEKILSEVQFSSIDEEIVTKLQTLQEDREVTVSAELVPERDNPFSE